MICQFCVNKSLNLSGVMPPDGCSRDRLIQKYSEGQWLPLKHFLLLWDIINIQITWSINNSNIIRKWAQSKLLFNRSAVAARQKESLWFVRSHETLLGPQSGQETLPCRAYEDRLPSSFHSEQFGAPQYLQLRGRGWGVLRPSRCI